MPGKWLFFFVSMVNISKLKKKTLNPHQNSLKNHHRPNCLEISGYTPIKLNASDFNF